MNNDIILIGKTYYRISAISSFRADAEEIVSQVNGEDAEYDTEPLHAGGLGRRADGTQPPLTDALKTRKLNPVYVEDLIAAINGQLQQPAPR